jgi:aminoglycoside phosphotransferase family enzyme/predicted kinase
MSATTVPIGSQHVVELLSNVSSYPDRPSAVQVVETHISWVFLTDHYAYKLKKPVQFEFLDFSTPELRHRACLDEVRLNRRLAPDVYIAVLPITQDSSGILELNGRGQEIEWVVQMRRLPAKNALDVVLREDRLTPEQSQSIATHLTDFYVRLSPKPIDPARYRAVLNAHVRANGAALLSSCREGQSRVRRIQSAQLRFLNVEAELFDSRATDGRIVEGHGDLRPEHIFVDGRPIVIDCIEFSEELRTVDIADELSFLGMECQRLGDEGLGKTVIAEYQKVRGDYIPDSLLSFYLCYRALVRAKVAIIREQQQANDTVSSSAALVRQYIDLADRCAKQLGPPMLLIVGGLMGSGKSTLAENLADAFAIDVLSTDHIRQSGIGPSETPAGYGEGNYQPDMRSRIYDELFCRAGELLKDGQSVVLDGTFLTCCLRNRAYDLGARHGAKTLHVQCTCPRQIAYARIEKRTERGEGASEARTELYDLQARDLEPVRADEPAIAIDTTCDISQQFRAVCNELKRMMPHRS